ncbi:succinate-semialdehyde dehydrogenase [Blattabacterium sp. (Cryptocercus kyebangensis)]|uniref:aldehyde dehydrogenase family protein n=1 Tax=Blattabacterium sp. (Cryptocercus kyebangensis) TaxID=298656 RepID=UPI000D7C3BE5|nr:aldehyde dehydrogenase family protein [Blattabacterium sp. (Cryptocercus kyebangensis)]AWU43575.1 succinate-semialdehyde dehydrogenase [Blattabacterium sp. (Cryptocercus kyebangensis)]
MRFQTINPVDNNILNTYSFIEDKEINDKLTVANKAYEEWRYLSFYSRIEYINKLTSSIQDVLDILSYLITQEMGKPITQSRIEVNKSINLCKYYADLEESIFFKNIYTEYEKSYIRFEPIGPILGIMPWNYPIWQIIRYAIPNILLGNVIILKPSINTAGCSILLEKIFIESGFPKGIFQVFLIDIPKIELVIGNPIIQGVSFTGSHLTGSHIGHLAGKYIKKSVLELGGNDAFIVMKDVNNIQKTAKLATESRLNNTGQSCISAKRFIIDHSIVNDFIDVVIQEMKKYHKGDLYEESTKIGYISRSDLSEKLYKQYKTIISNGGKICLETIRNGNFFSPSLLKIEDNNFFFSEEIFGPIGLVYTFYNEKEIPSIVNATCYGLGASIWTKDLKKAEILSKKINTGMVFVNEIVKSDPRFPFGGVKKSGYGRELSVLSIKEFSNWKTIIIKK